MSHYKFHQLEENFSTECRDKVECEKQLQLEKQEHDKLRELDQVHVLQLEDQKAENARMHQLAANIQANLEHYQQQLQIYQHELNHKNQQLIEFEKRTAILADQCDQLQKNLFDANNKIEILRHEKLFLTQEESQLEVYLKQFQQTA